MKATKDTSSTVQSLAPAARTTSANGASVNLANYSGNFVLLDPGTLTDGVHTPKLQESSDNSTWTDVAAADQVGTLGVMVSNTQQKVSYIGAKQYIRPVMTVTGSPSTGLVYACSAILSGKRKQP